MVAVVPVVPVVEVAVVPVVSVVKGCGRIGDAVLVEVLVVVVADVPLRALSAACAVATAVCAL